MDVAVWCIPEDWQKALSSALLSLEVVAKLNDIILEIIQFWILAAQQHGVMPAS